MRIRCVPRTVALLALSAVCGAAGLGGCAGTGASATARSVSRQTPLSFRGLEQSVRALAAAASRGDAASVRSLAPGVMQGGVAQLKAPLPHDVARTDVPRYLEGRHAFGRELTRLATALESNDERELLAAALALAPTLSAWIDAYLGLAPETAV